MVVEQVSPVVSLIFLAVALLWMPLWVWMLYDCLRHEDDRHLWLILLVFAPFPCAILYFLLRFLSPERGRTPGFIRRRLRRRRIAAAETAARNIGNAHQYCVLGNTLLEVGESRRAAEAFEQAVTMDGGDRDSRWGAARAALALKDRDRAREHLATLLRADPSFKFGDASILYAQVLQETGDLEQCEEHLRGHLRRWNRPEASVRLAEILINDGLAADARTIIEKAVLDAHGAPSFTRKRDRKWLRKARALLRAHCRITAR